MPLNRRVLGCLRLPRNHVDQAYLATAVLLLALSLLGFAYLPLYDAFPQAICVLCFAALSYPLSVLQRESSLSERLKTGLAWSYGLGGIFLFSAFIWLTVDGLFILMDWSPAFARTYDVLLVMMLIPLGAAWLAARRSDRTWQKRACLLGGLSLLIMILVKSRGWILSDHIDRVESG